MVQQLESEHEACVMRLAGEWRRLRERLHEDPSPQGLNEASLPWGDCAETLQSLDFYSGFSTKPSIHNRATVMITFKISMIAYESHILILLFQIFLVSSRSIADSFDAQSLSAQQAIQSFAKVKFRDSPLTHPVTHQDYLHTTYLQNLRVLCYLSSGLCN